MVRITSWLVLLAVLLAALLGFPVFESGTYIERFETDSYYLDYCLHIPDGATKNMPLIVFLHGDAQNWEVTALKNREIIQNLRAIYGDAFPFIVLSPSTREHSWTDGEIPSALMQLIDATAEKYCVDRNRIIVTGFSRGAVGVWWLASNYPDRFSLAVPVSCDDEFKVDPATLTSVPIIAYVGDSRNDYGRFGERMTELVDGANTNGGNATLTVLENTNHSQTCAAAYNEYLFERMLDSDKN